MWIGVDLDGTLAEYNSEGHERVIGKAIPAMVQRIKNWIRDGNEVRIVTARACNGEAEIKAVQDWLEASGLPRLRVTNEKDFAMFELWDDRAITVEFNKGEPLVSAVALAAQRMARQPKY